MERKPFSNTVEVYRELPEPRRQRASRLIVGCILTYPQDNHVCQLLITHRLARNIGRSQGVSLIDIARLQPNPEDYKEQLLHGYQVINEQHKIAERNSGHALTPPPAESVALLIREFGRIAVQNIATMATEDAPPGMVPRRYLEPYYVHGRKVSEGKIDELGIARLQNFLELKKEVRDNIVRELALSTRPYLLRSQERVAEVVEEFIQFGPKHRGP